MSKRKYTKLKVLLPEINEMIAVGKSHREIEEHFGPTEERPSHHLLKQEHRREKKLATGGPQKSRDWSSKDGQRSKQNIKQFRMEN